MRKGHYIWNRAERVDKKNMPHVVDKMLREGVDVNVKNRKGQTALTTALRFDNVNIILSLLCAGASTEDLDNEGHSAKHFAQSEEALKLLSQDIETNIRIANNEKAEKEKLRKAEEEKRRRVQDAAPKRRIHGTTPAIILSIIRPFF